MAMFVSWAITPGAMFVIGWVFESRTLPFGDVQSKAFLPGDLCLGVVLGMAVRGQRYLPEHGWWQGTWWPILVVVVAVAFVVSRRLWWDAPNYAKIPGATASSPTKWYHDIMVQGVHLTIIVVITVPVLFCMAWTSAVANVDRLVLVMWLAFYVRFVVYDARHEQVEPPSVDGRRPDLMHPSDWRPIWRRKK
jgi:hypothetical protein